MEETDILIILYLSGKATISEQVRLLEWLEEDETNRAYFRSFKDIWDLGKASSLMSESQMETQWKKITETIPTLSRKKNSWQLYPIVFLRYAAVLFIGIFLSWFTYKITNKTEIETELAYIKIETGIGDRTKMSLPDGTTVWINACSYLTFTNDFGKTDRQVELKGEAYFEVETDSLKPFLVHTDLFTYRVTGTSFNVYSFDDENEANIALLEGGVTIEYGAESQQLYPGEILYYDKQSGEFIRQEINVNHLSSWRYGDFTFDNLTFEELARRLERMFDVKFIFHNKSVSQERFGGTLLNSYSLEKMLKVISTSIPVRYRYEENIVHVY